MALKTRIDKLEKSQLKLNPYMAELRKMSDEELLAELARVRARAAMMGCPTDDIKNAPI
ncbi:hypothetical protein [Methylovulum miyakonense]|uniref:hypothetical protein n=1 Tax=Methylovulum miyakonense TaxID=645578 RepID=UPI000377A46A|nr:hypothetical protein [Methylovulum miyakonense]